MTDEIWKKIDEFENYSVSTIGRVNNNDTGKLLTGSIRPDGYRRVGLYKNGEQKFLFIHRLIAIAFIENPENKEMVDHIDNNPSNNLLENLRWATNRENQMNSQIPTSNTSGVRGVNWHKQSQKWRARIMVDGKRIDLGYFDSLEKATLARQTRANEEFGEFTNSCELIS